MQTAEAVVFVHPMDWNLEGPLFTPQKTKQNRKHPADYYQCTGEKLLWQKKPGKKQTI